MPPAPSSEPTRISLRDIAKKMGISHATVSMALRNHPRISSELRTKIQDQAITMGYKPDPMLSALAHYRAGKTPTAIRGELAWMNAWPDPRKLRSFKEFDQYWKGASEAATKFGYRLEEFICSDPKSLKITERAVATRGVLGLLIPPQFTNPDWADFPWKNYALVRFGRSCHTPAALVVTSDQVSNTMRAVNRIRALGYVRIGFVVGERLQRGMLYQAGFLRSQAELPVDERLPPFDFEAPPPGMRQKILEEWLDQHRPDAILTDVAELREMIEKSGRKVPDDIGLAAESLLDGNADAGIDQHPEEIGRVGLLLMMSLLNDHVRGVPAIFRQILVEGSWVDGSTLPSRL